MIPVLLLVLGCGGPAEVTEPGAPSEVGAPVEAPARLGLGRPATHEEIAAWDIDVDPRGRGLPPGRGTVEEGRVLYRAQCAACHGLEGEGGVGPQVVGTEPSGGFGEAWEDHPRTIGNWWPHATTIYDYVHRAMPQTAPGSLTPDQTYALAAFLLAENGAVPADFVADASTLPAVKMPTRVTFEVDDRASSASVR